MIKGRLCDLYKVYGRGLVGRRFRSDRSGYIYTLTDVIEEVFYVRDNTNEPPSASFLPSLLHVSSELSVALIPPYPWPLRDLRHLILCAGWLRNKLR